MRSKLYSTRDYYKPFDYPWAVEACKKQKSMHWLPEEVPMKEDISDWKLKLTPEEKNLLTQIFRFFTQGDLDVAAGYIDRYMKVFKNPDIRMMMATFVDMEVTHVLAYSYLLDTVGMPESEYKAFLDYEAMKDKHEYIENNLELKPYMDGTYATADILKSIAIYSAFTEGMQLFSSFAILLNFTRFGKMKGMGQIVTWSVKDECYSEDTEILTEKGWVAFPELKEGTKVAQFNSNTEEISFVLPERIISYDKDEELVNLKTSTKGFDLMVTKGHDLVYHSGSKLKKIKACNFKPDSTKYFQVAGSKYSGTTELTFEERVLIALQADGTIPKGKYRNGNHCGYRRVSINIKKERKRERLEWILDNSSFDYWVTEEDSSGHYKYYIDIPTNYPITKRFKDWVKLESISSNWGKEFVEELINWDGHIIEARPGVVYYSSVEKDNTDVIQAICALSDMRTSYGVQKDDRKESYRDMHRLWIYLNKNKVPTGSSTKEYSHYKGKVYCVTVPDSNIIVRRNNRVVVSGNCLHVDSMIKVFQTLVQDNLGLWKSSVGDEIRGEIYETCRQMVDLEDRFIDLAFEQGGIQGLTKEEVKQYIRYIADRRLLQLGLKPNYGVKENPLPWLADMLNSVEHGNFFETRVTEYTKGRLTGQWPWEG